MLKVKLLLAILLSVFSFNTITDEYSDFWDWFQSNESKYYKFDFGDVEKREKLFDQLSSQLLKIDENVTFEFGILPDERIGFRHKCWRYKKFFLLSNSPGRKSAFS